MSSQAKYQFSTPQRFGVWVAHGGCCFWCGHPIEFFASTVDHVLAESLLQEPLRLAELRVLYALDEDFQINDFSNWVPSHGVCNSRKGVNLEPSPSPAMLEILRRVREKASKARAIAARLEKDETRSKILARVRTGIERGVVTESDIKELLAGCSITAPVTIAGWQATPTLDAATELDVRRAPTYPGWTRIGFEEQVGIEAALLGQSMGPRHVDACPQVPEVREIVSNLEKGGAVAVTGESGCGKSMAAWHAAYELHKLGWEVYLLTNPVATNGELPRASKRALLVIDDAQSLPSLPARAVSADSQRAVMAVSTSRVPGFRTEVRLSGKRCVAVIAAALRERGDEVLSILSRMERDEAPHGLWQLGMRIDDAARRSQYPWQFMFNLGGGHRRIGPKLAAVATSEPLDWLLYAIAAYQLATRDAPCPLEWLAGRLVIGGPDRQDLLACLGELEGYLELVRTIRGVATPHPRVAALVVRSLFDGTDGEASKRRELLWGIFRDPSFPFRGLRWLLDELPANVSAWYGLSDELTRLLLSRCYSSEDVGGAASLLSRLVGLRAPDSPAPIESIDKNKTTIVRWIETCDSEHAPGVADLLNSIINHDKDDARALIESVDPAVVADRIQRTTPSDGYTHGYLVGRLAFGSADWKHRVIATVDAERLVHVFSACERQDLRRASEFLKAIALFDESLALALAEATLPAMVAGFREDPAETVNATRDTLWYVFRYGPKLLRFPDPDERRTDILKRIFTAVGAVQLAKAYQAASTQSWNDLASLTAVVRQVAPDIAEQLSTLLDVKQMLPAFGAMNRYELEYVVSALALDEQCEPGATVVREVCARAGSLSWYAAMVAPDAAAQVVMSGGKVELGLKGGLPEWRRAAIVLAVVSKTSPDAAKAILREHRADLADGLLFRQSNGGDGAIMFLQVASEIDDEALVASAAGVDVATARETWAERARGTPKEQAVLAHITAIAGRCEGEISRLAHEIREMLSSESLSSQVDEMELDDDL